jgi:Reverse transcriptase (RNA-dependent DNA polymerase)
LCGVGIDRRKAWDIARESTVEKTTGSFSLPYGFVQSPALASLALDRSALGRQVKVLARSNHTRLSCYVDDLVLSGAEDDAVESGRLALIEAARLSNFVINTTKSQLPAPQITVFNIVLSNGEMALTRDRMHQFETDLIHASLSRAAAILAYARTVTCYKPIV